MGKLANQKRRKRQRDASKARAELLQSRIDARRDDKAEDKEIAEWLGTVFGGEEEGAPDLVQQAVEHAEGTPLEGLTNELAGILAGGDIENDQPGFEKMLAEVDGWLDRYAAQLEGMEDGESNTTA